MKVLSLFSVLGYVTIFVKIYDGVNHVFIFNFTFSFLLIFCSFLRAVNWRFKHIVQLSLTVHFN